MKVLAFDQATTKTGYALFESGGMMAYGLINLSGKAFKDAPKGRLTVLKISELIEAYQPDYVAIEDVALQKNAKTLIELSRIQGGVIGDCDKRGIPVMIIKPSQWRKICALTQGAGVKRTALKREAKNYVNDVFNVEVTSDEADAICIGWAAWVEATAAAKKKGGNEHGERTESV